ncbi:MAG TPA: outer membrane beta-barrel domain-containing protein [Deltaproteobacteria bacterium]|nr:outer membrane beta-barrel domain-containing protein [Deltaproteobacteria bacterium]
MNPSTIKSLRRLSCVGVLLLSTAAQADSPGLDAKSDYRAGRQPNPAVENRFFLKENRFEIAPIFGYVPNNPFARRYVGGAILGYHFSETFSAQFQLTYSPDLGENDLKELTSVLLERAFTANTNGETNFQQPLDKVELGGTLGVTWAPIYGKINLVGETVLNFDFYLFGGLGMVSKTNYVATYDDSPEAVDIVNLSEGINEVRPGLYIGLGQNYFLSQSMAFKLDLRSSFYIDNRPQYDPEVQVLEQRLYNNFVAGGGIALFFPKMQPRLYDF